MLAIAENDRVWLECSSRTEEKTGLSGLIARFTGFGHARRMIMELPAGN